MRPFLKILRVFWGISFKRKVISTIVILINFENEGFKKVVRNLIFLSSYTVKTHTRCDNGSWELFKISEALAGLGHSVRSFNWVR